nr:hypothetical protein Iba_chr03aCG8480 [Ipomoea batatas]GMC71977.1 hypothetical protein Iba_chr03bCG7580 [Ipomoea batatas]
MQTSIQALPTNFISSILKEEDIYVNCICLPSSMSSIFSLQAVCRFLWQLQEDNILSC